MEIPREGNAHFYRLFSMHLIHQRLPKFQLIKIKTVTHIAIQLNKVAWIFGNDFFSVQQQYHHSSEIKELLYEKKAKNSLVCIISSGYK